MDTVTPRTTHTVTGIMARDAWSTPRLDPITGIMGGVLTTGKSGTTGTVTGAKPSKSNDLSWLKNASSICFVPATATKSPKSAR
jgi:hypothetical protein